MILTAAAFIGILLYGLFLGKGGILSPLPTPLVVIESPSASAPGVGRAERVGIGAGPERVAGYQPVGAGKPVDLGRAECRPSRPSAAPAGAERGPSPSASLGIARPGLFRRDIRPGTHQRPIRARRGPVPSVRVSEGLARAERRRLGLS